MINGIICGFGAIMDFFQTYSGAISAIATVFIAVFTYILKNASQQQGKDTQESLRISGIAAKAARDNADALISLERPYLFPELEAYFAAPPDTDIEYGWPIFVDVKVINHGRAPAILTGIAVTCFLEAGPRQVIQAGSPSSRLAILEQNKPHYIENWPAGQIGEYMLEKLRHGDLGLFVHGIFVFDDVAGNSHTAAWHRRCWPDGRIELVGGKEHNKTT